MIPTLPDDILNAMAEFSDNSTRSAWGAGDTAALAVDRRKEFGMSKTQVRQALANRAGLKLSTVRKREAVARYWDDAAREEFGVLSYGYFETAMRQPDPHGDLVMVLESAADYGGLPMPLSAYTVKVRERKHGKADDPRKLAAQALDKLRRALECDAVTVPVETRAAWARAAAELESVA